MFAPGADQLAADFHITNQTVASLTVSIYVLGFAIGPLLVSPLSELYGRRVIYHSCAVLYFAFTVACAFSTDTAMFLIVRFLAGCVASGPMTVGGGTVADVTLPEKRGVAMALFFIGPLLGPVSTPCCVPRRTFQELIDLAGRRTHHWRFRYSEHWLALDLPSYHDPSELYFTSLPTLMLITTQIGLLGLPGLFFLRETNATVLLERKAERLRKETGNSHLVSKQGPPQSSRQMFSRAIVRPAKMLLFSPIVLLLSLYTGLIFGLIFLLFTTFPDVFEGQYGFSAQISGLAYLGLGLGMGCGLFAFSTFSDKYLKRKKQEGVQNPELRLVLMKVGACVVPVGCFLYGWTARYKVHWIVPIIGTWFIGFGALFIMMPIQVYLVDAYGPKAAASALGANLIVRSLFGAFLPLAGTSLYDTCGLGWGNSLLGFICLGFVPVPWLFLRYGEYLRTHFSVDL